MSDNLTPFDTGETLEPTIWPDRGRKEDLGCVDFDNEEGATIVSAQIVRDDTLSDGAVYRLRLWGMTDMVEVVIE